MESPKSQISNSNSDTNSNSNSDNSNSNEEVELYDWKQLESNPDSVNQYMSDIGVDMSIFCFQDLFSTEEWAIQSCIPPVLGLLFIFHWSKEHCMHRQAQYEQIMEKGQHVDEDLFYMKQYAKNACGSVGVYHILGNLPQEQRDMISPDSTVGKFLEACEGKTPEERGKLFRVNKEVKKSHVKAVAQTEPPKEAPKPQKKLGRLPFYFICGA